MADKQGTLQSIGTVLTTALRPLTFAFSGTEQFKGFMLRLGWSPTDLPPAYQALTSLINAAIDKLENLGDNPSASDVLDLVHKAVAAFQAVRSISTAPPGVDAGAFLSELPERLFEILLVDFIAAEAPTAYNALVGLNVIKFEHHAAAAGRPTFLRVKFDWAAIPKMISDPGSIPQQVFGWGTPDLDAQKVIDYAAAGLLALGLPVFLRESDADAVIAYSADTLERVPAWKSLDVLFYSIAIAGKNLDALFRLRPLPAFGSHLPGFVLEPVIPSEFPLTMKLADDISMRLRAGTNVSDLFGLVVQPDGVSVTYPFAPGTTPPSAGLGVGFDFKPSDPAIVLGEPRSTRLQFKGASLDLAATFGASAYEFTFGARMTDLALVLAAGESDGFIKKILGDGETTIAVPLGIEWSNISGVTFKGSGGFEVALYPHLSLGPIDITELIVRLAVPADPKPKLNLEIGATLSGDLGPLKFSVEEIGLRVYVTFEHGNAGPFDVDLGFKPPKGAGLLIDAGIVAGGGYLFIDSEHGRVRRRTAARDRRLPQRYRDRPDRRPSCRTAPRVSRCSIIITAEFGPGIQLGFGFTLLAVGGLLGLNRTMAFQAAARRRAHRRDLERDVPAGRHRRTRRGSSATCGVLPAAAGHVPDRADGEARLGQADADQPVARRHHRDPARRHRDPRRAQARAAGRGRCRSSCCRSTSSARSSSTSSGSTSSPRSSTRASCS